jgi:hypothetical protein
MDVIDLLVLLVECVVVGAGMAIGDWIIKVIAVKILNNSEQATLHDVEEEPDEDEARRKRARKKPPKPDMAVLP